MILNLSLEIDVVITQPATTQVRKRGESVVTYREVKNCLVFLWDRKVCPSQEVVTEEHGQFLLPDEEKA